MLQDLLLSLGAIGGRIDRLFLVEAVLCVAVSRRGQAFGAWGS